MDKKGLVIVFYGCKLPMHTTQHNTRQSHASTQHSSIWHVSLVYVLDCALVETVDLNELGGHRAAASGHLALAELLRDTHIDGIGASS